MIRLFPWGVKPGRPGIDVVMVYQDRIGSFELVDVVCSALCGAWSKI